MKLHGAAATTGFIVLIFSAALPGCREDPAAEGCLPSSISDCYCADGRAGTMVCDGAGEGWGPCACPGSDGDADADDEDGGDVAEAGGDGDADADAREWPPDADESWDIEDDPDRRLQEVEHLDGETLRSALESRVADHASLAYADARLAIFTDIDVHGGVIECVYTGITAAADGSSAPGTLNTEHSWPRSDGAETEPAESDLHHLFPTDSDANSRRGSWPFGETDCSGGSSCLWEGGGSQLGPVRGGASTVFEVRREYRGDIARAHFYFAVRYAMSIPEVEETFLRAWNRQDPPSAEESARNDVIEGYQSNRNPFVDRPDFVGRIGDF